MRLVVLYIIHLLSLPVFSQNTDQLIAKGNEAYRLQQYDKAATSYRMALKSDPHNGIAAFNLGNALYKSKLYEEAAEVFGEAAGFVNDTLLQSQLLYNKGVALTWQKALDESITAYKQALRLNPSDTLARENLQRAINEQKQQQQKEDQQKKQEQKEKRQQPQQNTISKQQIEQLLKALEEQERKLHDKKMKRAPAPGQPEKDW